MQLRHQAELVSIAVGLTAIAIGIWGEDHAARMAGIGCGAFLALRNFDLWREKPDTDQ